MLSQIIATIERADVQHKRTPLDLLRVVDDFFSGKGARADADSHWKSFAEYAGHYLSAVPHLLQQIDRFETAFYAHRSPDSRRIRLEHLCVGSGAGCRKRPRQIKGSYKPWRNRADRRDHDRNWYCLPGSNGGPLDPDLALWLFTASRLGSTTLEPFFVEHEMERRTKASRMSV
ncbi:MAG: hypothetical protein R3D67_14380 [Hyphomicrobiaceae bacterium]